MNCTPDKCPHRALLEKARAACLSCDHLLPAGHGGTISYDAAGERTIMRQVEPTHRSVASIQATPLPIDVEDKLRMLLNVVTGLDSIDALLALHIANGGTPNTFGRYLLRIVDAVQSFDPARPSFRATVLNRWNSIKKRFEPFSVIQSWKPGHGGAKVRACGLSGKNRKRCGIDITAR